MDNQERATRLTQLAGLFEAVKDVKDILIEAVLAEERVKIAESQITEIKSQIDAWKKEAEQAKADYEAEKSRLLTDLKDITAETQDRVDVIISAAKKAEAEAIEAQKKAEVNFVQRDREMKAIFDQLDDQKAKKEADIGTLNRQLDQLQKTAAKVFGR